MKVGDLVKTIDYHGNIPSFTPEMGVVVERDGAMIWVRWFNDGVVAWMPKQSLQVISESR